MKGINQTRKKGRVAKKLPKIGQHADIRERGLVYKQDKKYNIKTSHPKYKTYIQLKSKSKRWLK